MASINFVLALLACFLVFAAAAPGGYGGGHHEHIKIHVPYHVHTIHHHHTKVIKVPVVKKEYIHVHDHHDHSGHHEFHGGWW